MARRSIRCGHCKKVGFVEMGVIQPCPHGCGAQIDATEGYVRVLFPAPEASQAAIRGSQNPTPPHLLEWLD